MKQRSRELRTVTPGELLVVITTIGILISLLLPVLQTAARMSHVNIS